MTVYVCASVTAATVSSIVFYFYAKKIKLCGRALIITAGVLNALFCAVFPLLFSAISGVSGQNEPVNGFPTVLIILLIIFILYLGLLVIGFVLRSPGVKLNAPLPAPDGAQAYVAVGEAGVVNAVGAAGNVNAVGSVGHLSAVGAAVAGSVKTSDYSGAAYGILPAGASSTPDEPLFGKNSVDTAQNIDKMGISADLLGNMDSGSDRLDDVDYLVNCAFDSLGAGNLEEAAEYFYNAIDKHPKLGLEVQIAIQLSMIYSEIGHAGLSLDILKGYITKYGDLLSDMDMAALEAGVSNIEIIVAGSGGEVNEEN